MMGKRANTRSRIYVAFWFLGSPLMRIVIIFLCVVLSMLLGYINGYAPFWEDVQLPAAVQARSARIDTNTLEAIIEGGKQRGIHNIHMYDQYRTLFAITSGG